MMSTNDEKKQKNRLSARNNFMRRLDEMCGLHPAPDVGRMLEVSEEAIGEMIASGEIVAFRDEEGAWQVPGFQFHRGDLLPHLGEVKNRLGDVSAEAICTFFLNPVRLPDGQDMMPWQALASEAPDVHLAAIKSEASLFMRHVAR